MTEKMNVAKIFGENVFNDKVNAGASAEKKCIKH